MGWFLCFAFGQFGQFDHVRSTLLHHCGCLGIGIGIRALAFVLLLLLEISMAYFLLGLLHSTLYVTKRLWGWGKVSWCIECRCTIQRIVTDTIALFIGRA